MSISLDNEVVPKKTPLVWTNGVNGNNGIDENKHWLLSNPNQPENLISSASKQCCTPNLPPTWGLSNTAGSFISFQVKRLSVLPSYLSRSKRDAHQSLEFIHSKTRRVNGVRGRWLWSASLLVWNFIDLRCYLARLAVKSTHMLLPGQHLPL